MVIYNVQDQNAIDNFLQRMEILHKNRFGSSSGYSYRKDHHFLAKDLAHLHLAQGYPET